MYMYKVKKMSSQRKNTIKNKYNFISEYMGKKMIYAGNVKYSRQPILWHLPLPQRFPLKVLESYFSFYF